MEGAVQLRSEETGIVTANTLKEAFALAEADPTIWKISFGFGSERVRLVRENNRWVYESIL